MLIKIKILIIIKRNIKDEEENNTNNNIDNDDNINKLNTSSILRHKRTYVSTIEDNDLNDGQNIENKDNENDMSSSIVNTSIRSRHVYNLTALNTYKNDENYNNSFAFRHRRKNESKEEEESKENTSFLTQYKVHKSSLREKYKKLFAEREKRERNEIKVGDSEVILPVKNVDESVNLYEGNDGENCVRSRYGLKYRGQEEKKEDDSVCVNLKNNDDNDSTRYIRKIIDGDSENKNYGGADRSYKVSFDVDNNYRNRHKRNDLSSLNVGDLLKNDKEDVCNNTEEYDVNDSVDKIGDYINKSVKSTKSSKFSKSLRIPSLRKSNNSSLRNGSLNKEKLSISIEDPFIVRRTKTIKFKERAKEKFFNADKMRKIERSKLLKNVRGLSSKKKPKVPTYKNEEEKRLLNEELKRSLNKTKIVKVETRIYEDDWEVEDLGERIRRINLYGKRKNRREYKDKDQNKECLTTFGDDNEDDEINQEEKNEDKLKFSNLLIINKGGDFRKEEDSESNKEKYDFNQEELYSEKVEEIKSKLVEYEDMPEYIGDDFCSDFIEEVNNMRKNDGEFAKTLDSFSKKLKIKYTFKKREMKEKINELYRKLRRNDMGEIIKDERLMRVAETYLKENAKDNAYRRMFPFKEGELIDFLKRELNIERVSKCQNFISRMNNPRYAVLDILFNEMILNNKTDSLNNENMSYIGVSQCKFGGENICYVLLTDDSINNTNHINEGNKSEILLKKIIRFINNIRENPKKFAGEINDKHRNLSYKLRSYFKTPPLKLSPTLNKALLDLMKTSSKHTGDKFTQKNVENHLKSYCYRVYKVMFFVSDTQKNYESYSVLEDFVVDLIKKNFELREGILSPMLKRVGGFVGTEGEFKGKFALVFTSVFREFLGVNKNISKPVKFKYYKTKLKLNRPELTEEELENIRRDFNTLDVVESGRIYPDKVLLLAEKDDSFKKNSPFYYKTLKNLDNKTNNVNGITCEAFIDMVEKVISDSKKRKNFTENWSKIFALFFESEPEKRIMKHTITKDVLKRHFDELNIEIDDEELEKLMENLGKLDEENFIGIIKEIEGNKRI